jgi:hypothetical protein
VGQHDREGESTGEQEPGQLGAPLGVGPPEPPEHHEDGDGERGHRRHDADGEQRGPHVVQQRHADRVELEAAHGCRQGLVVEALGDRARDQRQDQGEGGERAERDQRRHPQPPRAWQAAVGEQQQDQRQGDEQDGAEPQEEVVRRAAAGRPRCGLDGVRRPAARGGVDGPRQAADRHDPGDRVAGQAAQQQRTGHADGQTSEGARPRRAGDRVRDPGVEDVEQHADGGEHGERSEQRHGPARGPARGRGSRRVLAGGHVPIVPAAASRRLQDWSPECSPTRAAPS